jgi:DNA invertase Pin-like site-specific DNA recombinase
MPTAYSYLRFSTPEQMKGDSFRRQKEAAETYATEHGLELDNNLTFRDLGVSAYRGANSETGSLGVFLKAVREGIVPPGSYLLVESLDRISRQYARKAQRVLEDIVDEGVTVVTLCDGRVYDSETLNRDPLTLLASLIIFIRANEESSLKSARVRAAFDRKRNSLFDDDSPKEPFTRRLPSWILWDEHTRQFVVDAERAEVVKTIFDWADQGLGQHAIAQRLNQSGVQTFGKSERWHRSYIKKLLSNPAVIGTFVPHIKEEDGSKMRRVPQQPKTGYWPPVVDMELFERVAARCAASAPKGRNAGAPIRSIVAGLGRCATCGSAMTRVCKGKYVYVVCSKAHAKAGCSYRTLRYGDVELALRENAVSICDEVPRGNDAAGLEEQIALEDLRLSTLSDEATELMGELVQTKSPTARRQLAEIERAMSECRVRLQELRKARDTFASPYVVKRIEQLLKALTTSHFDVAEANRALKAVANSVSIDPANGIINIKWSEGNTGDPIPVASRHVFE